MSKVTKIIVTTRGGHVFKHCNVESFTEDNMEIIIHYKPDKEMNYCNVVAYQKRNLIKIEHCY